MYGYKIGLKKVGESVPAAPANVVQPLLSGSGAVDTVVTSSSGTWTGFPTPTFNYDFKLNTVSVQSGASNTFTPGSINEGETLTVTVTATNSQGSASVDSSNSLVVGTAPLNTVAPTIFGDNTFGSTLTTTDGTFTGTSPITYIYQWQRGGSPISGQTANTYVIGASDSLAAITCVVTGTNSYGFDSEVSNTITVVDFAPVNTVAPTLSPSGTQSTGTLITANDGTWSGVAPITFEYKWTRNGIAISGATASTYTIQLADDGTTIRVEVKGTNAYGVSAFIASSNSVSAVNTVAPTISSATISGTAVVGQTLTASASGVTGIPTPTLSYQWKRGATNIGTNATTYTLVAADAGNTSNITCVVTATNAGGSANATSNQIAQILTVRTNSFLTASAITDATIRGGLNTFDIGLISNSLDTKMKALYPFVGGTASTHKWNFMNAADTDAAFRLAFSGTVTHSTNGAQGNGVNGYADSFFIPNSNGLTNNNNHLSLYSRTTTTGALYDMGSGSADGNSSLTSIFTRRASSLSGFDSGFFSLNRASYTIANSGGFYLGKVNSDLTSKYYRNGTQVATRTITIQANLSLYKNYLLGFNENPITVYYSPIQFAFASFGTGLTDTDATNYYTLVQALQTTLGRQI